MYCHLGVKVSFLLKLILFFPEFSAPLFLAIMDSRHRRKSDKEIFRKRTIGLISAAPHRHRHTHKGNGSLADPRPNYRLNWNSNPFGAFGNVPCHQLQLPWLTKTKRSESQSTMAITPLSTRRRIDTADRSEQSQLLIRYLSFALPRMQQGCTCDAQQTCWLVQCLSVCHLELADCGLVMHSQPYSSALASLRHVYHSTTAKR